MNLLPSKRIVKLSDHISETKVNHISLNPTPLGEPLFTVRDKDQYRPVSGRGANVFSRGVWNHYVGQVTCFPCIVFVEVAPQHSIIKKVKEIKFSFLPVSK